MTLYSECASHTASRFGLWQWGFVPTIVIDMGIYMQTSNPRHQGPQSSTSRNSKTGPLALAHAVHNGRRGFGAASLWVLRALHPSPWRSELRSRPGAGPACERYDDQHG